MGREIDRNEREANLDRELGSKEGLGRPLITTLEEVRRQPLELFKNYRSSREIVWLSPFCPSCKHYQVHGNKLRCEHNEARLVKPFFGKIRWSVLIREDGMEEYTPLDINWDKKGTDVDDGRVELAMANINLGKPYPCFTI